MYLGIDPGGYFPSAREEMFLIVLGYLFLRKYEFLRHSFIIQDKIVHWEEGAMYFVDTARMHYLFNASFESQHDCYSNAILNKTTVDYVILQT